MFEITICLLQYQDTEKKWHLALNFILLNSIHLVNSCYTAVFFFFRIFYLPFRNIFGLLSLSVF